MNGANSYNICPRCGNSNSLSAKYCSRCGGQLKVPEEPVVCHKCHTHNSPIANFCRNCGAELKVGLETKICPKCGKEVYAHDNVCTCGYSFVTFQQTAPAPRPVGAGEAVKLTKGKSKVYSKKGGRGWAIATMILMLLFGYLFVAPTSARPGFLWQFDGGIVGAEVLGSLVPGYAYDYVRLTIDFFKEGGELSMISEAYGVANIIIYVLVVIVLVTMLVQFIACFVRIFTKKRSKHCNWYYFTMGLLSLILVGLIYLFNNITVGEGFMDTIASVFRLPNVLETGYKIGLVSFVIPLYFWFFFFLSIGSRAKILKEER